MKILRIVLPLSLASAALSAQAITIDLRTAGDILGHFEVGSLELINSDVLSFVSQSTGELPPFDGASMYYARDIGGPRGEASFYDPLDTKRLDVFMSIKSDTEVGGIRRLSGAWTYNPTPSRGAYAGFSVANSGGVWDFSWNTAGTAMTFNLSGNLNPVPEPASIAALSLGTLGALRRRKKA